jgi:tRNA(Arg) A34 adenosine deaminase TadA
MIPTDQGIRFHKEMLRRALSVARQSRNRGDHPFGALLVGPNGQVLREQGNGFSSEGGDMTAHAERLLATWASKTFCPAYLADCTLYSSAEPCAMCAGAIYRSGIGRVVFLAKQTSNHPEKPTLDLPCREVFAKGQRRVEVIGPLLEDEAAELQREFWDRSG